jgi:hypothetical protein
MRNGIGVRPIGSVSVSIQTNELRFGPSRSIAEGTGHDGYSYNCEVRSIEAALQYFPFSLCVVAVEFVSNVQLETRLVSLQFHFDAAQAG